MASGGANSAQPLRIEEVREDFLACMADELVLHEDGYHSHASRAEQAACLEAIVRAAIDRLREDPP